MATILELNLKKLIRGEIKYQAVNFGLNLLIARLQKKYNANQTPGEMDDCLQQMNSFLQKYKNIMTNEIEAIEKL